MCLVNSRKLLIFAGWKKRGTLTNSKNVERPVGGSGGRAPWKVRGQAH